jgi:hypothetical protein
MDRRRAPPPPIASVGNSSKQKAPVGNDAPISKDPAVCFLPNPLCLLYGLDIVIARLGANIFFQFLVQERCSVSTSQLYKSTFLP